MTDYSLVLNSHGKTEIYYLIVLCFLLKNVNDIFFFLYEYQILISYFIILTRANLYFIHFF